MEIELLTRRIFNCPTAPFRENWVLEQITHELHRMGIAYFRDQYGNLIAGAQSQKELRRGRNRLGFIAHTDHPGFHLHSRVRKGLWKARWLGGSPTGNLKGFPVAVRNPLFPEKKIRGLITKTKSEVKNSRGIDWIWISVPASKDSMLESTCFGAFDFPGFLRRGKRIFTRAADDLAGCVIILGTLAKLKPRERKCFLGIFTRAEEVGFRGALGTLYSETIPMQTSCVSLEASRTLPGARLGLGPVIRLGDRRTLFDSQIISALDAAAEDIKKKDPRFAVQRRIMDGGTCEATPFNLYGRRCAGLAVPLGNYHNQSRQNLPAPEYIDIRDLERAIQLCAKTVQHFAKNPSPFSSLDKALRTGFQKDKKLLQQKVVFTSRLQPGSKGAR